MPTPAQRFEEAKAVPEAIRQEAVRAAAAAYARARKQQLDDWGAALAAAREAYDAVKEDPDHPDHDRLRAAVTRLEIQPSSKPLRDEMDRAIQAAGRAYQDAVAGLCVAHGIKPLVL